MKSMSSFLIATVLLLVVVAPSAAALERERDQGNPPGLMSYLARLTEDLVQRLWPVLPKLGMEIDPGGQTGQQTGWQELEIDRGDTNALGSEIDPSGRASEVGRGEMNALGSEIDPGGG